MLNKWKNAALHMLIVWVSIFKCLLNQHPRSLTSLAGVVTLLPTYRVSVVTLASCCRPPMMMNSVLPSFNLNLSQGIHSLMLAMPCFLASTAADCSALESALIKGNI